MISELFKYHGSTTINRKAIFVFPLWHNYSFHLPNNLENSIVNPMMVKKSQNIFFLSYFDDPGVVWGLCGQKIVPLSSIEADNPSTNVLWVLWLTNCLLPVHNLFKQWNQQCSCISESKSKSNILKSRKIKSSFFFTIK